MTHVSDIKLIRTDTTLDLSQKAEKGMLCLVSPTSIYFSVISAPPFRPVCVGDDIDVKYPRMTEWPAEAWREVYIMTDTKGLPDMSRAR